MIKYIFEGTRTVFILSVAMALSVAESGWAGNEELNASESNKHSHEMNGRGPASDPLDPVPYRMRALQLRDTAVPLTTGTEFNPAISVILDFTYANFTDDIDDPPGFLVGGGHGHGHGHGHGVEEGFNLREMEVTFSGSIDPYFDALAVFNVTPDDLEVEEAYITTRMLPAGLQVKAGKFLSDVGYINKQHIHDWLFVDAPWMREFMFGDEGLNEAGVQLSWVPPTPQYTRFGVEILEGATPGVSSFVGDGRHEIVTLLPDAGSPERVRWRADKGFSDTTGPRLFTGFAKWAPDLGYNHAIQFGTFGGYSREFQAEEVHSSGRLETWDGDAWFAGGDVVYKYDGQGVMGHGNVVIQAEYMYRELDLRYQSREFESFSSLVTTDANDQRWQQDGLYVQGVYGFLPRWNAGARLDILGLINDGFENRGDSVDFGTSYRYTGQVAYGPTEFSRIRAQVSYNDIADGHDEWQFMLQYSMSLGVHGAHAF